MVVNIFLVQCPNSAVEESWKEARSIATQGKDIPDAVLLTSMSWLSRAMGLFFRVWVAAHRRSRGGRNDLGL